MTIKHSMTFALTALLLCPSISLFAAKTNLEQARSDYHEARDALAAINKERSDEAKRLQHASDEERSTSYEAGLKIWFPAYQQRNTSYETYVHALVHAVATLPAKTPELHVARDELLGIASINDARRGTESHSIGKRLLARAIHPCLLDAAIPADRAELFATLTKPSGSTRFGDTLSALRIKAEPIGWSVQSAHSLAHLRAGNVEEARKENDKLLRKAKMRLKSKGGMNYWREKEVRSYPSLYREYLIHDALIEAHAGGKAKAKSQLQAAEKLSETAEIKAAQATILAEVTSLIK